MKYYIGVLVIIMLMSFGAASDLWAQDNGESCQIERYITDEEHNPVKKWCESDLLSDDMIYVVGKSEGMRMNSANRNANMNAIIEMGEFAELAANNIKSEIYQKYIKDEDGGEVQEYASFKKIEVEVTGLQRIEESCSMLSQRMSACYHLMGVSKENFDKMISESIGEEAKHYTTFKATDAFKELMMKMSSGKNQ